MTQVAEEKGIHLSNFSRFEEEAAGAVQPWLDEIRQAGISRFKHTGFPGNKEEEWRFTNVAPIARVPFQLAPTTAHSPAAAEIVKRFSFGHEAVSELVFVDGYFVAQLSKLGKLPRGVKVTNVAKALETDESLLERHVGKYADITKNPFVALNAGFIRDGAFIHVPRGVVVEGPIHLLFVSTEGSDPTVSHPRSLVLVEQGAQAQVVESYVGDSGVYFTNAVTEIILGDDALVDHCKLQQESREAFHVATMQVNLGRQANFISHSASLGSRLTRNDLNVVMGGEAAEATLNGLVVARGNQHIDNHTLLDHAKPNCPSHELYKHVLADKASGVFKGKILVRQDAQKTDSKQTSKSLLLSDDAMMNSQPALEIYADDVKCTHGSTIGPVDEEQVFYLRSRGVGLEAARHLMTYAFAADVTRRIKVEPVRRRLEDFMAAQHGLPQDLRITDLGSHDEAAVNL